MMAAHRDVFRVLYSMAQLDEHAVGGAVHRLEEARARGMARMAERLGDQGLLRDGVTVADANSLIWMYGSFDAFDVLYTGRGLSVDEIVELFTDDARARALPLRRTRAAQPRRDDAQRREAAARPALGAVGVAELVTSTGYPRTACGV